MSLNAKLPPGRTMPLWPKLGERLGEDLADFSPTGTLDAISAFQHEFGRSKLVERLMDILNIGRAAWSRSRSILRNPIRYCLHDQFRLSARAAV